MKKTKSFILPATILTAVLLAIGSFSCGVETSNSPVPNYPNTRPSLVECSLLNVPAGEVAIYSGQNAAVEGDILTYMFYGDGTLTKLWMPDAMLGRVVSKGTWKYEGNGMTLYTEADIGGSSLLIVTEKYSGVFTFEDGNKLSYSNPNQVEMNSRTIIGDYSMTISVEVALEGIMEMKMDSVDELTVNADWTWDRKTTSVTEGFGMGVNTGTEVKNTNGILDEENDNWIFMLPGENGNYFILLDKDIVLEKDDSICSKDITQFTILGIDGTIGTSTIDLTVPYGTDVTDLAPTIVHTGAGISPESGEASDFTDPVIYKVTARDGSTKDYTVTVTESAPPSSAKDITQFTILGVDGAIGESTIALTVPYGTNATALTPTITTTGVSVSPASGAAQNFSGPVNYTVTAEDNSTKVYTVTVSVASSSSKNITQFTILGVNGTIGASTIALTVPYGTDRTNLTPTIAITGASVIPASGSAQNFTSPVNYTVTANDSSTKVYTVTVTVALNPAKNITQFTILGVNGTIGTSAITLIVPFGTSLTSLTPTITHTGASVNPASGSAQNFTNPVNYTVTAADSSTKVYTVTVTAYVDLSIPTIVPAAYLTVPSGSVVYIGPDPASPGNNKTLTFKSDGTFSQYWKIPSLGWKTTNGTWSYDTNHVLTLYHQLGGTIKVYTTEIYDLAFVYDGGNKLTFYTSRQSATAPHGGPVGSTIIGTYNSHVNVHVEVPLGGVDDTTDTVGVTTVTSGNPFPWSSTTTSTKNDTPQTPVLASGTLAIPAGVWLFNIGSDYFIQVDQSMVLTKQ